MKFDVIIVGGSYAGLAAAMALGRALRTVLVIDSGLPCNRQTPYSHNFLTRDGSTPRELAAIGRQQVGRYNTVDFIDDVALRGFKKDGGFEILTASGQTFYGLRLVFATGIRDRLPLLEGLSECWGISVLHCPFCHGFEVRGEKTGILGNGDDGFELARLISNWTSDLTLFTNGRSTFTPSQQFMLQSHYIRVVEKEINRLEYSGGQIQGIVFNDHTIEPVKAMYLRSRFEQHCTIAQAMGCSLTAEGYVMVDDFQETTVGGIYACGDNVSRMRTVANAVAMGTATGMNISKKMFV
ncbi:NAD(P)/FAD-dependent oxidoreductase [Dinghuibacter silviterrae]|uniref:Thioredoxin reductase n=1 Tax=Dinghuibacter silviterrae TaxID=1539049 RepID=A0A4R8DNI2_9BACT|nr:NAD(P)/FAD-dependent oxidoreductase [Dinghuibacter silviterrae]TDW99368.1 thioredoxin reductase [Dinghuibacter silviterrae]